MTETKKKPNFISWLTVFLMIYVSNDTLLFGTNLDSTAELLGYAIPFLLTVVYICKCFFSAPSLKLDIKLLALLGFNLFSMLINSDLSVKYGYSCMIILLAYMVSKKIDADDFEHIFKTIMAILAFSSLVATFLYYVAAGVASYFPVLTNQIGLKFSNLFLAFIPEDRLGVFYRNYGIFREPGVFIIFLSVALIFELFGTREKPNLKRVLLYLAAVAFTYSTAGYIVDFLILITFLFSKTKTKHNNLKFALFLLAIAAAVYVFTNDSLYDKIFSKFFVENSSTTSRFGAISINLTMTFRDLLHPITGNGYSYVEENFIALGKEQFLSDVHNTNTALKVLSVYGIPYFCIFVYGFVRFCKKHASSLLMFVGLLTAFFLLLSNEDLIMNILPYLIIFYSSDSSSSNRNQSFQTTPPLG